MLGTRLILEGIGEEIISKLRTDLANKSLVNGYPPPNASMALSNSLRYEATDDNLKIFAKGYIYYLEFGRGKNKNQDPKALHKWVGWAGSTFLKTWVETKGISISPYAIAYSIARKGTLIHRQGGSDLLSSIINDEFIAKMRAKLIFDTFEGIRSDILKLAA